MKITRNYRCIFNEKQRDSSILEGEELGRRENRVDGNRYWQKREKKRSILRWLFHYDYVHAGAQKMMEFGWSQVQSNRILSFRDGLETVDESRYNIDKWLVALRFSDWS